MALGSGLTRQGITTSLPWSELVRKVEAAGFVVERVTSFVTLALPLMAASRFADRRRTRLTILTR